jgi:hypothetical protein
VCPSNQNSSIENKGMKKLIIAISIAAISATTIPAQAAESKSLVIIDSYFDSRVSVSSNVCIASSGCNFTVKNIPTSLSSPVNHGDAMVEVAKRQNPNLKIIALRSANASATAVNEMNTGDLINALAWVNNNSINVGAVSLSRFFNGKSTCSPSTTNTAAYGGVSAADTLVRNLISSLKSKGIPVFASTGNIQNAPVDYPACITDTNSVGVGDLNKLKQVASVYSFDLNTDYFATGSVYSFKSSVLGLIPNTTSAGNVAVAAKYLSGSLDNKFVNVLQ